MSIFRRKRIAPDRVDEAVMNCADVRSFTLRGDPDSLTTGQRLGLIRHIGSCRSCHALVNLIVLAELWAQAIERDQPSLQPTDSNLDTLRQEIVPRIRLLIEGYRREIDFDGSIESIEAQICEEIEILFLETPRAELREIVRLIDRSSVDSEKKPRQAVLAKLMEHVDWADKLADASGVPDERVVGPPDPER